MLRALLGGGGLLTANNLFLLQFSVLDFLYNPGQNISDKLYFFCEIAPYGKSPISVFQEFFASIDKILILGAGLSTRLQFYGVLRSS